jgi:hypothetical protein
VGDVVDFDRARRVELPTVEVRRGNEHVLLAGPDNFEVFLLTPAQARALADRLVSLAAELEKGGRHG